MRLLAADRHRDVLPSDADSDGTNARLFVEGDESISSVQIRFAV